MVRGKKDMESETTSERERHTERDRNTETH